MEQVEGSFRLRIFERVQKRHSADEDRMRLRAAAGLERDPPELFETISVIVLTGFGERKGSDEEKRVHRQGPPATPIS